MTGMVIFLPPDPMKAAKDVRDRIEQITKKKVGVIITDTCGRSFRRGQTGHAIGWSGFTAIRDFRGDTDLFGHELKITEEAVVDEIAGFANFVMGESNNGVPAVHFRNCPKWTGHDNLYFSAAEDITRRLLKAQCPEVRKKIFLTLLGCIENVEDKSDDTDDCGNRHNCDGADVNCTPVLTLVIVDETR